MRLLPALLAIVALPLAPPLIACSIVVQPHIVDTSIPDRQPPVIVSATVGEIIRGRGPVREDGNFIVTSCDDIGSIRLRVEAEDLGAGADQLGWEIRVDGEGAPKFFNTQSPIIAADDTLTLFWSDGATNDQEALDFTIRLRVIDRAGNTSEWSECIRVIDAAQS